MTNLGTGERLQRLCWQVDNYSDQQFSFTERNQDRRGNIFNSSVEVYSQGFGRAEVRIRTTILAVGSIQGGGGSGGLLNNILGVMFGGGGGSSSPQRGAYYVRGGRMNRDPGSERVRLPEVDLARLRCR